MYLSLGIFRGIIGWNNRLLIAIYFPGLLTQPKNLATPFCGHSNKAAKEIRTPTNRLYRLWVDAINVKMFKFRYYMYIEFSIAIAVCILQVLFVNRKKINSEICRKNWSRHKYYYGCAIEEVKPPGLNAKICFIKFFSEDSLKKFENQKTFKRNSGTGRNKKTNA